jgi:hypothetical protein
VAGALTACSPKPAAPPDFVLDCAQGYDALAAKIAAIPDIKLPKTPGEPYHYYSTADGTDSFVVTLPGGAGHPAIVRQTSSPSGMAQAGCSWGDKPGYDRLNAYLKSLAGARHR